MVCQLFSYSVILPAGQHCLNKQLTDWPDDHHHTNCISLLNLSEGAGKGKPEVIVLDPHGLKDAIPVRIMPHGPDTYTYDYTPA